MRRLSVSEAAAFMQCSVEQFRKRVLPDLIYVDDGTDTPFREEDLNEWLISQKRLPPRGQPDERWGQVYFIEAEGSDCVKIGFTEGAIADRVAGLQTGCPHPLRVRACFRAQVREERELHRRFASLRTVGEWFRLSPALREEMYRRAQ